MKRYLPVLFLIFYPITGFTKCPPSSQCTNTSLGILESQSQVGSGDGYAHLKLNGIDIYKRKTSYMTISMDTDGYSTNGKFYINKAVISYWSDKTCFIHVTDSRCSMNTVLDLTTGKPIFSNEFYPSSEDAIINWVSWGKSNSIIVFEDESKFKYANGHVEKVTKEKDAAGENDAKK